MWVVIGEWLHSCWIGLLVSLKCKYNVECWLHYNYKKRTSDNPSIWLFGVHLKDSLFPLEIVRCFSVHRNMFCRWEMTQSVRISITATCTFTHACARARTHRRSTFISSRGNNNNLFEFINKANKISHDMTGKAMFK